MRGIRNTDKSVRKFITINDTTAWEQIDKIMELPQYEKSFNKVINDALFYGLPALYAKLFGGVEMPEEKFSELQEIYKEHFSDEEFYAQVIRLLRELIVNVTVNKSMLSSLFNAVEQEYRGSEVAADEFAHGAYSDTPAFIEKYEIQGLLNARK